MLSFSVLSFFTFFTFILHHVYVCNADIIIIIIIIIIIMCRAQPDQSGL